MASALSQLAVLNGNKEEQAGPYTSALQLVFLPALPAAIKAAVELGLFDIMAGAGPEVQLSAFQLASKLPTRNSEAPAMLDRILRLLASFSIFTCSVSTDDEGRVERLYGMTPTSSFYAKSEDGISLAPLLFLIQDKIFTESWLYMKDAILEGGVPFDKAHGMDAFQYPGTDPRFNRVFNEGMAAPTTIVLKKVVDTYKGFEDLKELVDVGGGVGTTLMMINSKYPHIHGINFDLPHVVADAPIYPGIDHVGGDMFVSVPSAEAIFMKWVLHDWSDEKCLQVLKNCYHSLPESGKVIIVDAVAPSTPERDASSCAILLCDITMLSFNPGGKERTFEEFSNLAKGAGFTGVKSICSVYIYTVMEFYK